MKIASGIKLIHLGLLILITLTNCAVNPMGPRVRVMPAPGKPLEQFSLEDQQCRTYAQHAMDVARGVSESNKNAVGTAAVGAAVGATIGSVLGRHHSGAQEGAIQGLIMGGALGASQSAAATQDIQYRYDIAYEQCMYTKGNQVPSIGYQKIPHFDSTAPSVSSPPPNAVAPASSAK